MKDLTAQQSKVLNCIEESINKTGFPPTRAEICQKLGFKSPNAAEVICARWKRKISFPLLGFFQRNQH